jgi:hypothetical protein
VSLVAHDVETNPVKLCQLSEQAKRLAGGVYEPATKSRLTEAAAEYDQWAKEIEMDEGTGQ